MLRNVALRRLIGPIFLVGIVLVIAFSFLLKSPFQVEASLSVAPSHRQSSLDGVNGSFFGRSEVPAFVLDTAGEIVGVDSVAFENEKDFGNGKRISAKLLFNDIEVDQKLVVSPQQEEAGKFKIEVESENQFKPGKYQVRTAYNNGQEEKILSQDFTWGVLALNLDQSSYKIDEMANFGIGVLDDLGRTVCDAKVWLRIIDASGQATEFSTENKSINTSDTCADGNVTNIPDYSASYIPKIEGNYKVELKAETKNGPRSLIESFEVINSPDFVVRRFDTSMRIYPPASYTVNIEVLANKDLSGGIKEKVPASFEISNISVGGVISDKNEQTQIISWPASLKADETAQLSYQYDAPDESPQFYLLGPIEIWQPTLHNPEEGNSPPSGTVPEDDAQSPGVETGSDIDITSNDIELESVPVSQVEETVVFSEPRAWQIAADALPSYVNPGAVFANAGAGTVGLPAGIAQNNILILFVETENEASSVTAAGSCSSWAAVADSPQGTGTASDTAAVRLTAYWCRYGGSGTTGPTISDSGDHQLARIIAISGVITTGDPWDVTSGGVEATNGDTSGVISGDITTDTDRFVIAAIATALPDANGTAGFASFANAGLANFAERTDNTTSAGTGGGLGIATGEKAAAGTYGNTTVTTSGNTAKAFMSIALKPAPSTVTVGTSGTQTASMLVPSTEQYVGGAFTFVRNETTANVTSITVSETDASFTANSYLANLDFRYETAATCTYNGGETLLGTVTAFSGEAATLSSVSMAVGTSQVCLYLIVDVVTGAPNGDYFDLEITNPSTGVSVSSGVVAPATAIAISGSTQVNLAPAVKQDHFRWRNDNGPQDDTTQTKYFNPTGNGYGTADFVEDAGCANGSEWDCVDDDATDTADTPPAGDTETSELILAAASDYYTLADDALPAGVTVTQLDITVLGADDIGNPNTSVALGYCIVGGANDCGTSDTMGAGQAITGADQTKTQQFAGLSISLADLNNMQLVVNGDGVKAEISTLYVLITYNRPEATWAQTEDTPHTGLDKSTNIRLRFQVDNTGGAATNYNYRLEWAARGADNSCDTSYTNETYYAVPDTPTTEHFDMTTSASSYFIDGDPTTTKLSNAEAYSFVAGDQVESTSNQSGNITINQNEYTESEYVFQANSNATDAGVYCLRVTNAGSSLNSADAVAQVTLSGGNTNPNTPSSLGPTGYIDASGWMNDNTPTFSFDITDPDTADLVKYRFQIDDTAGFGSVVLDYQPSSFGAEGTYNYTVGQAGSYAVGSVSMTLSDSSVGGGYYWRVKAIDDDLAESAYEEAGTDSTIDFRVDATAPTGGSVYDGVSGDQDWNDGSLTQISGNWTGINSGASGLQKYEYAIRRANDNYYWSVCSGAGVWQLGENWCDNATSASFTQNNLNLRTGETYYVSVRTTDVAANVSSPVNSNGQQVSPNLTFTLSTNSVTFANLNNSNNWTDSQSASVTTSTNATNGFTVKAYTIALLTSLAYPSITIPNFSGTWADPIAWTPGLYGFGYTSSDVLVQGSNRYNNGTEYAGFSQLESGNIVADHTDPVNGSTGAIINESHTLTFNVAVSSSQAASAYRVNAIIVSTANY